MDKIPPSNFTGSVVDVIFNRRFRTIVLSSKQVELTGYAIVGLD